MTRTLTLLAASALAAAGAFACSGGSPSGAPTCDLDPALDATECQALHGMSLPSALPPARGNAKADDENAAGFGFQVFFDVRFSAGQSVRCATCHLPEVHFDDGKPVSVGLSPVTRNSPTVLNAARMGEVFWDGRADSLWSQPLFAFENPKEMGSTRLEVAHAIAQYLAASYERAFGPLPPLDDTTRFPAIGKPGDAAWDGMAAADQDAVNRVAANVGKALEAYDRKLAAGPSRFDRFLAGDATALSDAERHGMVVFAQAGCMGCHSGPMLSDMGFHNLGVPAASGADPDQGRAAAYAILSANPFNGEGPYVDGPAYPLPPAPGPEALGAFRTPTLRNVTLSGPYMHNGSSATLKDAIAFHLSGGGASGGSFVGTVDAKLVPHALSDGDVSDLVTFMGALEGTSPVLPWSDWPH